MDSQDKPELQNRIVAIIGRKGTGKSTKLAEILASEDRILIFDPMAEHDFIPNNLQSLGELAEFFKWTKKKNEWAATFVPGEEIEQNIEDVSKMVYNRGNLAFAIEEVPLICSPGHLPKILGKLIRTGRHREIDIYWTAQRAGECSRTLTSLTDEFILYSQTEPLDLDAIAKRCTSAVADRVAALHGHDYLVWDVARRELAGHDVSTLTEKPEKDPPALNAVPAAPGTPVIN
jgi:hypothetical protein